jgi:dolichyl-phosphate-mannose-protein mannosyltransferase
MYSTEGQDAGRMRAVIACAILCLAVTCWGFASTEVIARGLLQVWDRRSANRYLLFLALAGAAVVIPAVARARRAATAVLAVVWLVLAFGVPAVAAALAVFCAALGLGSLVAAPADLRRRFGTRTGALLSLAAGFCVLIAIVQVLAHFPVNTPLVYAGLLSASVLAGSRFLRDDLRAAIGYLGAREEGRWSALWAGIVLVVLAVHSVHAALPERGYDALAMHLTIPTYVASHARWSFDGSSYAWALFPMGGDWLYTLSHLIGGEQATRLLNFGLHASVVALLHAELGTRVPARTASLLTAAYSATPLAFLESSTLFVENPLSLFLLAAAILLARSWREPRPGDLLLVGLYAGGALATKLLAVFAVLPLAILSAVSAALSRRGWRLARAGVAAAVAASLVGAVPYLYSWKATGNPVFPFLNHVFRSPLFPLVDFKDGRWLGHLDWKVLYEMTFRSSAFGELQDGAFGFQHLLLLPAGVLATVLLRTRASWLPVAVGLAYAGAVLFSIQYLRYLYPAFPLLTLAEAEVVRNVTAAPLRRAFDALAALALGANLAFMPTGGGVLHYFRLDTVFSQAARDRWVEAAVPQRALLRLVNATDGKCARVLELGIPVGVEVEGAAVYTIWHNPAVVARLAALRTEEDVVRFVDDFQLTHVLKDRKVEAPPALESYLDRSATLVRKLGNQSLYDLRRHEDCRP